MKTTAKKKEAVRPHAAILKGIMIEKRREIEATEPLIMDEQRMKMRTIGALPNPEVEAIEPLSAEERRRAEAMKEGKKAAEQSCANTGPNIIEK